MKNRYQIRCKLKHKHYTDIINKYEEYYTNLKNIIRNIPYNKKKLLKHFPQNHFSTFDDFYTFTSKYKNVSFSLLVGDIEQQKNVILETIERRCNTIKAFSNNLKYSIDYNYKIKNKYDITVIDLYTFKNDILFYNKPSNIIETFPDFKGSGERCMYEYVYSIKTENAHHYIDLKNMILCDRILLCVSKNKLNIMFQSSISNVYNDIPSDKLKLNVETIFDNKLFHT
jgi:hypothetical protein